MHLQTAKQKILERLAATKEYQALLTVEKAIKDISEVLEVVADDAAPAASEGPSGKEETSTELATAEEQPERPVSNPTERLSTLGLVEEPRLTAMVRESFAANGGNEEARSAGEDEAEPEKAKVA